MQSLEERILRADRKERYTEWDIKRHLKEGIIVFDSLEQFLEEMDDSTVEDWNNLDTAVVDGVEYHYDVIL